NPPRLALPAVADVRPPRVRRLRRRPFPARHHRRPHGAARGRSAVDGRPRSAGLVEDFESFEPYHRVQCHPERSEPASEVEGSATRRTPEVTDPSKLRMTFAALVARPARARFDGLGPEFLSSCPRRRKEQPLMPTIGPWELII